jgi:IMP dehydrogenase
MRVTKGYTFDDVLLVPKHSKEPSREKIDLSVQLPKGIKLSLPIVSANMKTVTGVYMAHSIATLGGLALLHRFDTKENILRDYDELSQNHFNGAIGCSIGVKKDDIELAKQLAANDCNIICVDVAHGDHELTINCIKTLRKELPDILIIAGNVATTAGAKRLWLAGADIIKVGIGGGSVCSTRIETGNGYPQLSALDNIFNETYQETNREEPLFISDGGIRFAGDCVKALCFSHLVMLGNMLAGTDESPGDTIVIDGRKYKQYAGSSTYKSNNVEGVSGLVPYRGPVANVIQHITQGIQSGLSYQGSHTLDELKIDPVFVEISQSGIKESHPHDLLIQG